VAENILANPFTEAIDQDHSAVLDGSDPIETAFLVIF
jgi:hypothetical protein